MGSSFAISDDSIYYEQVCPHAINAIHKAARVGQLGTLHTGMQLLLRHQDRIMWIQERKTFSLEKKVPSICSEPLTRLV